MARPTTTDPLPRLAPPPRDVPPSVRLRLLLGGLGAFAWIWLGFGSAMATVFLRQADLTSWVAFRGEVVRTVGEVTACRPTRASEGGSKGHPGRQVKESRYRFEADGEAHQGASYATWCAGPGPAEVEYPAGRPERSRLVGMRRAPFGPQVALVAIFPLVGMVLVGASLRAGLRQLHLLRHGRLALGTLVGKEATLVSVNKRPVMRLRFRVPSGTGAPVEVVVRTHLPGRLEDEPRERILYDADHPGRAAAWDLLPGAPRVDFTGALQPAGTAGTLLRLLPPLLALAALALALRVG